MEKYLMNPEEYINIKSLSDRLDGDFGLFKELAELFISDSPRLLSLINEAIKNNNGEKIGKTSHTMKGAVANFSADRAFNAALDLEKIGKNNEFEKVEAAYKNLSAEIDFMREALKIMIAKPGF
jgi:two-component system, sensor histidine kinase and response regulator